MGYGKAFPEMFTGSMMGAGGTVFAVWTYAIANVGRSGHVELNPKLLTTLIGDCEPKIRDAIAFLCKPDPESRSKEEQGRRLLKTGEFEYYMVNFKQYDTLRNEEERREYKREWDRKNRPSGSKRAKVRQKSDQSDSGPTKNDSPTPSSSTSSSTSTKKKNQKKKGRSDVPDKPETKEKQNFAIARKLWPGQKRGLETEFAYFCKQHRDWRELLADEGLAQCIQAMIDRKSYGEKFWPQFSKCIHQRLWEIVT